MNALRFLDGSGFLGRRTRSWLLPLLLLSGTGCLVPAASAELTSLGLVPCPHPLERYASLWTEGWFNLPTVRTATGTGQAEEPEFPFTLTGIAEWNSETFVYLSDEEQHVHELSLGRPSDDLELISVRFGGGSAGHKAVVRHRSSLFNLEFYLEHDSSGAYHSKTPVPVILRPQNVRIAPSRPTTRSSAKQAFEDRRSSKAAERNTRDWLEGWFED